MISKLEKNTVFIGVKKSITPNQFAVNIRGTGFILEKDHVITCAHVVVEIPEEERKSIFCGIWNKEIGNKIEYRSYDLNLVDVDTENDIALLRINKFDKADFGIKKSDLLTATSIKKLKRTDKIYFLGFPLANEFLQMGMGITLSASECIIGAVKYKNKDDEVHFILIDKLVNPGNSGSPVYKDDKLIGIASGTFNKSHKIGEALINIPVSIGMVRTSNYIREILMKNQEKNHE